MMLANDEQRVLCGAVTNDEVMIRYSCACFATNDDDGDDADDKHKHA